MTNSGFTRVMAQVIVSDHDHAVDWYQRLLGRPVDTRPMDGLAEWHLTDAAWLQVFAGDATAGHSVVTVGVADLDQHARRLADNDIELDWQTTSRGQHVGTINDPAGNLIVFAQDLQTTPSHRVDPLAANR